MLYLLCCIGLTGNLGLNYSEFPDSCHRRTTPFVDLLHQPLLFALERLLDMAHIVEQGFSDAGFGIDDVSSADNGERYLLCVP